MKHLFGKAILVGGVFALAACQTVEPGSPEATAIAIKEAKEETVTTNQQIVSDIPDWCLNVPSSNFALYRCGIGESSNLNMARNRATLDAKRGLADSIDSQISSRMEDFLDATGTGDNEQIRQRSEIVTKNVTVEAQLVGYKEINAES